MARVAKKVHSIAERKEAQRKHFMCDTKVKFATYDAAVQKGQRVYRCPYCRQFHRASYEER